MEEIWNKINNHIKYVGKDVEDFEYKIQFDGVYWHLEIFGTSIDREKQQYFFDDTNLESLYKQLMNEF